MTKYLSYGLATVGLAAYSAFAFAGIVPPPVTSVPEPGTMSLLAGGAVAVAAVYRWRRRK